MKRWLVLLVATAIVSTPLPARAHGDPPGCFALGISISISTFRSDGVTGVVGSIQDCEQIFYQATLAKLPSPNNCAFSGGQFTLTTPDGTVTTISSSVPCLGGTSGEGCVAGTDFIQSGLIPYTASPADVVGGFVSAAADYAGGTLHDTASNTPGVTAHTPKSTPVVACAPPTTSTPTTTSVPSTTTSTTLPKSTCSATKLTTATKLALLLAKCDAKGVKGGVAAVQACRDKAIAKFTAKWTSLETKPDCFTTGDQASIQDLIDACTTSLLHSLVPYSNP